MEKVIIEGVVEHGRRLGRELGFPTANLAVPEDVAAATGSTVRVRRWRSGL